MTHVLHDKSDPRSKKPRSSKSWKWKAVLEPIWQEIKEEGGEKGESEDESEEEEEKGRAESEEESEESEVEKGEGLFLKRNGKGLYLAQKKKGSGFPGRNYGIAPWASWNNKEWWNNVYERYG